MQLKGLQEENKSLRQDNATLAGEVEQMNRVASYVGSRVAKVLAGARRANNYNAALVGELKRWNRKLEVWNSVTLSNSVQSALGYQGSLRQQLARSEGTVSLRLGLQAVSQDLYGALCPGLHYASASNLQLH